MERDLSAHEGARAEVTSGEVARAKANGSGPRTTVSPVLRGKRALHGRAAIEPPASAASTDKAETNATPDAEAQKGLVGVFDAVHGRLVEGWAYDARTPSRILTVEIRDSDRLLGAIPAKLFRADLAEAGIGDGCHAFRYALPLELFDGQEHVITARVKGADFALQDSPRVLRTAPLPSAQAFPSQQRLAEVTPPLSDLQFTMLRALNAIAENLSAQGRALALLVDRLDDPAPARVLEAPPPSPEALYGALLPAALAAAGGPHDVLFFSIIDWHFRTQRPQHLAAKLAALGSRVFYLSVRFEAPDPSGGRFKIRSQSAKGVFEIVLTCRPPEPSIYAGIEDERQIEELSAALAAVASELRLRSPVGVVQFPGWYPVAMSLPGMVLIHDCLDHVAGFNAVSPRVVALEDKLIREADAVVATSEYLADIVRRQRPCEIVRNGAEVEYFSTPPATRYVPPARPVIGYYGAIADWFDMELVVSCAHNHPEWHFILIGATEGCDVAPARKLANIVFLGEKPYSELTHYLYSFDVCIIPFKLVDLIKATNPVKLYEYLCAGKPIVATDMPELRRVPAGLLQIARSPGEFEKKIAGYLKAGSHNSGSPRLGSRKTDSVKNDRTLKDDGTAIAAQRREWAARHSWSTRAAAFSAVIDRQFPTVSIVVLCYNNLDFTRACLSSLLTFSDYPELEIVCVDNASSDATGTYLEEMSRQHHAIRHVRNPSNLGFAAGNNVGLKAATGEIRVVLNNDTYVTKGWIRDLIRPLLADPRVGMTGPLSNMIGNEQKIVISYSDMQEMAASSAAFTARRRRCTFETENLAFFCVAIRREVIETVGYLDESFSVGFFEDDDYCRRARQAGYRLLICDDVFVHHHLSASFDKLAAGEKAELMQRNRKIFEAKWGPWTPHRYRDQPGFGE